MAESAGQSQQNSNLNPPTLDTAKYQAWKRDVMVWSDLTNLKAEKKGLALFLSLPTEAKDQIRERITHDQLKEVKVEADQSKTAEGFQKVLEELDKLYGRDTIVSLYEIWEKYKLCKRKKGQTVHDFLKEFDLVNMQMGANEEMKMPDAFKAIELLDKVNLTDDKKELIKATVSPITYEGMKKKLKEVFCDMTNTAIDVKEEDNTDVTFTAYNQLNHRGNNYYSRGSGRAARGRPTSYVHQNDEDTLKTTRTEMKVNPPSKCSNCGSIYHWARQCDKVTDARPGRGNSNYRGSRGFSKNTLNYLTDVSGYTNDVVFENVAEDKSILAETKGRVVIDSGAPHSVCGVKWYNDMIERMCPETQQQIEERSSESSFRFGDSQRYKSIKKVMLPITVAEKKTVIPVDIVECDIPCLLSKSTLQKWKASINFEDNSIELFGQKIPLVETRTGHLCLEVCPEDVPSDELRDVFIASNNNQLEEMSESQAEALASKLHRQFAHAKDAKIIKLVENSNYGTVEIKQKISSALKQVSEKCEICRIYQRPAHRPVVGLPLATTFNECLSMDLKSFMYNGKQVTLLNMIDQATRYCSSVVVTSKDKEYIINKILEIWIRPFGRPQKIHSDNGGEFINSSMIDLAQQFGISIKTTAAESPWSNGLCEKSNGIIVEMVEKILEDTNCHVCSAVAWAVNAKNSLSNVHGFSPYQLVFGRNPILPGLEHDKLPALNECNASGVVKDQLEALHAAREAFIRSENSEKIRRALRHNVRSCNDRKFLTGDKVYFKRNNSRTWSGPATVLGQEGQQVLVKLSGFYYRASPSKVILKEEADNDSHTRSPHDEQEQTRPDLPNERDDKKTTQAYEEDGCYEESEDDSIHQIEEETHEDHERLENNVEDDDQEQQISSDEDEVPLDAALLKAVPVEIPVLDKQSAMEARKEVKLRHKIEHYKRKKEKQNITTSDQEYESAGNEERSENNSEVNDPSYDPRNDNVLLLEMEDIVCLVKEATRTNPKDADVLCAKEKELQKWVDEKVYEVVKDEGQYRISTTWVVNIKPSANGTMKTKARLVARGYEEQLKARKDSPTCMTISTRIVISVISAKGWTLNSMDVYAAFLQGHKLEREVFVTPPKEAKQAGCLWKLIKAVYGLDDAPRNWYMTLRSFLEERGLVISKYDPALFFKHNDTGDLIGIMVCHVDDFLWGGNDMFQTTIINPLTRRFKIGTTCKVVFEFLGKSVKQLDRAITVNQNLFIDKVEKMDLSEKLLRADNDCELEDNEVSNMRKVLGQLNWVSGKTRPDLAFETCQISTKVNSATKKDVKFLNKAVAKLRSDDWNLMFKKLDLTGTLFISVFTDASFNNLPKGGSQEGYIILLADEHLNCCPIDWCSKRIKRVAKSTLSAETLAVVDGLDCAYLVRTLLLEIFRDITCRIRLFTDSKSLFETVGTSHVLKDKRLLVDMSALREMHEKGECEFLWIPTDQQIADSLTKAGASNKLLINVISKGTLKGLPNVASGFKKRG